MKELLQALEVQRWDDHRYYHHSRINQTLHLVSALSFLSAYALLFTSPVAAAIVGWLVAMTSRQIGHFFFEPKGYDHVNQATHEHKEEIKVGYNLRRKMVLLGLWALAPFSLCVDPSLLRYFRSQARRRGFHAARRARLAMARASAASRSARSSSSSCATCRRGSCG